MISISDRNFTYIHLHSDLSNGVTNIDSITKYDQYIQKANEYLQQWQSDIETKLNENQD